MPRNLAKHLFLSPSVKVFLDEISVQIGGLSKQFTLLAAGGGIIQ